MGTKKKRTGIIYDISSFSPLLSGIEYKINDDETVLFEYSCPCTGELIKTSEGISLFNIIVATRSLRFFTIYWPEGYSNKAKICCVLQGKITDPGDAQSVTRLENARDDYRNHLKKIASIPEKVKIEKESLLRHFEEERNRKDRVSRKTDSLCNNLLVIMTIIVTLLNDRMGSLLCFINNCFVESVSFESIGSIQRRIMFVLLVIGFYNAFNLLLAVIHVNKNRTVIRERFSDLKNHNVEQDGDLENYNITQIYFDWQAIRNEVNRELVVLDMLNGWIVFSLFIGLIIIVMWSLSRL